jgi:hypothetical protein
VAEGIMRPGMAKTARMLKTLEPRILPIARSCSFLCADTTDAASSGKLVPMAIIVKPIIKVGLQMLKYF